jgi:4-hydroxythreonine-4-phosphate dehydrogenase
MAANPVVLGFTLGDAAGVGPELLLRAWDELTAAGPAVVFGQVLLLDAARRDLARRGVRTTQAPIVRVATPGEGASAGLGVLPVLEVETPLTMTLPATAYPWGEAIAAFGALQHASLVAAVRAAQAGAINAVVTPPWHKARLRDAGLPPTGHTEVLESLAARPGRRAVMMLASDRLRVGLVTSHIPIRRVALEVTREAIVEQATSLAEGLTEGFGIESPTLALCGLNPHAGEAGTIGSEDDEVVSPAVAELRRLGIDATGPWPADTLFARVLGGAQRADAVLAMYHDQGLAPLKTSSFGVAANITLGLDIVRTSVDHGTAYDIAGRGVAETGSLRYAAEVARRMCSRRSA